MKEGATRRVWRKAYRGEDRFVQSPRQERTLKVLQAQLKDSDGSGLAKGKWWQMRQKRGLGNILRKIEGMRFFVFCLFRAAPAAYRGSQARSLVGATATGLRQSHGNARSEPCLQPTPQFTAMPDP